MSTNLEYRTGERQRKIESRRQASEAQPEKGRHRSRARDKKQSRHFFVRRTTWKFCSGGDKMRNASGHQCKEKMSGSKKKSEWEHVLNFSPYIKRVTRKFLEVSRCTSAKQRQRNVQKKFTARITRVYILFEQTNIILSFAFSPAWLNLYIIDFAKYKTHISSGE